jgi:cytochrome P450
VGAYHCYLVNSPDLIRTVLATEDQKLGKARAYEEVARVVGHGLFTSEGDLHRRQRRTIQPLFASDRIRDYAGIAVRTAARAEQQWQSGTVIDAAEEMSRLTMGVVGQTLFGNDRPEALHIARSLTSSATVLQRFLLPGSKLLWRLSLPSTRRFEEACRQLDALIYRLIAERRQSADLGGDLISLLLSAQRKAGGEEITDRQIRDEAVTMLLAGHETLAVGLTWTWYLLSQHAENEAKLHRELDHVLGGRPPEAADLDGLVYTRRVFQEAIRLYPPAWAIARRVDSEYQLGPYTIPTGSMLGLSQWVTHRDGRFFPDPLAFRPERWEPTSEQASPAAYFPFGGGPRVCIGERFAWTVAVLVLATVAQRWRFSLAPGASPEPRPVVTLNPREGMPMVLHRREAR